MFYDNFLKACNSIGKTPSAVLLEVGLGKSAGTRWKKGEMPTDATLQKLTDYFNIPKAELLGATQKENNGPTPEGAEPPIWAMLSEESKRKAVEYMEMLKALEDKR